MRKIKHIYIILVPIILLLSLNLKAQLTDYTIGLRMGSYNGITAKMDFEESTSFEMIMGLKNHGITSTFLLEFNKPIDLYWSRGFSWYYGIGTHFGYMRTADLRDYFNSDNSYDLMYTVTSAGIDGIIGLQYKFSDIPIELSIDAKPLFEIINVRRLHLQLFETSLTVRYKINSLKY